MRINPGESLEDWAKRVQQYEYGHALMRLSAGEPVELVMQEMSRRIVDKLNYPIIKLLKESNQSDHIDD